MRWNFVSLLSAAGVLACGNPDRPAETDSSVISASTTVTATDATAGTDTTATSTPTTTEPQGTGTVGDPTENPPTGTSTGTTVDPATTATTGDDPGMVVSIEIDPLDAIITVVDGNIPAATQYTATGVTDKGIKIPVTGTWSYDKLDLAGIGGLSGMLTATGFAGGVGTVTFEGTGDLPAATTSATVKLVFNAESLDGRRLVPGERHLLPDAGDAARLRARPAGRGR
jgi:hypothetical protein